jgi:hypothetical protein
MIGLALAWLIALGLIGIGVGALAAPRAASRQYGIAVDEPRALALIRAMGVRDLVLGALVLLLAAAGRRDLLALGIAISALVALLDFAVVAAEPASRRSARLLHAGGGLAVLLVALLIGAGV